MIPAYGGKVDNQTEEHVYTNPDYITIIVAGSAGSREKLSGGTAPPKDLAKYIEDYGLVVFSSRGGGLLKAAGRGKGEILMFQYQVRLNGVNC